MRLTCVIFVVELFLRAKCEISFCCRELQGISSLSFFSNAQFQYNMHDLKEKFPIMFFHKVCLSLCLQEWVNIYSECQVSITCDISIVLVEKQ